MRKEIFVTNKLDQLSEVRGKLDAKGIDYKVKTYSNQDGTFGIFSGMFKSSRRARGSLGENPAYEKVYRIYVDQEDEQEALYIINK